MPACLTGLLAAFMATVSAAPADVSYTISLKPGPRVQVRFVALGDTDGVTDLEVQPHWGGIDNDSGDVTELTIQAQGEVLRPEHPTPTRWTVTHEPSAPLTVTYIIPVRDRGPAPRNNDYRTRLDEGIFHMIGELGLLLPKHLDTRDTHDFSIRFDGFDDPGMSVMSSFGAGPGPFELRTSGQEFRHSLVIGGRIRTLTRDIRGKTVGFAIVGEDWGFTDAAFADLATRVIALERDFWPDHTDPWFLIALNPSGGPVTKQSFSFGGTGLTSCFSLYCNTGFSLDEGSPRADQIKMLLAHEYFHTWNGGKIPSSDEEGTGYWFSEGFTDFYARRLLHRAGMLSDSAFLEKLNGMLGEAATSPVKDAPAARIKAEFWTSKDIQRLPYHRGDQIAMAVDEKIRAASAGKRSLDDFMKSLLAKSLAGEPYSTDRVLEMIETETDSAFAASIRAAVVDGESVPLPESITEPKAKLVKGMLQGFEAGFNVQDTRANRIVSGVKADSAAYAAGLRDGQQLKVLSVSSGSPESPPFARITIYEKGEERVIEYDPLTPPRDVPAYQLQR